MLQGSPLPLGPLVGKRLPCGALAVRFLRPPHNPLYCDVADERCAQPVTLRRLAASLREKKQAPRPHHLTHHIPDMRDVY